MPQPAPDPSANYHFFATVNVKDHWSPSKYDNNEKVWNIVGITSVWHRDTKWADADGKMAPLNLPDVGWSQIFSL